MEILSKDIEEMKQYLRQEGQQKEKKIDNLTMENISIKTKILNGIMTPDP